MIPCKACGLPSPRLLCAFCRRTVALVKAGLCVSCTAPISTHYARHEGKCGDCLVRGVRLSDGTRHVLSLAAKARYRERAA